MRQEKMNKEVSKIVGKFLAEASNKTSLITISRADVSPDFRHATLYVTVFPEAMEKPALMFLERNRTDMRNYLRKNLAMRRIPFLRIMLDIVEKNRQGIYALLSAENATSVDTPEDSKSKELDQ